MTDKKKRTKAYGRLRRTGYGVGKTLNKKRTTTRRNKFAARIAKKVYKR